MRFGNVKVTALVELERWGAAVPEKFFPGADLSGLEKERLWMEPDHIEPDGALPTALQAFLIRTPQTTVLVDTNLGDAVSDDEEGAFGAMLQRHLVDVNDIDVVVNTHMHGDHIGGNTVRSGERWEPRFPRAKYVIGAADVAYWNPADGASRQSVAMEGALFQRCIRPLLDAGVVAQWSGEYVIDDALTMVAAAGHTPGTGVLRLESEGESAVFVGDLVHHAIQLPHPEWGPIVDEDTARGSRAREEVLGWAADRGAIVIPGHFPGSHALRVRRVGDVFGLAEWVALT
jgi:glyoxylase-like metal-dependent hydrolase (beta-lactamase superfamily II)